MQPFEGDKIEVRVLRSPPELEGIREHWSKWPGHRDADIDFYLMVVQSLPGALRPHVVVLYRNGRPDVMLIGRLERTWVNSKIGYLRLPGIPARSLTFVYGGLRGNVSDEGSRILIGSVMQSLRSGEADFAFFHQPNTDSSIYKAALSLPGFACRDRLAKPEVHHIAKLQRAQNNSIRAFREALERKYEGRRRNFSRTSTAG